MPSQVIDRKRVWHIWP